MFGNPTDGALDGRVVYDNADRALQFWTAGTQRVNITSGGNLEPHIQLQKVGGNAFRFYTDGTDLFIRNGTLGANRLAIFANGDVGVYDYNGATHPFFFDASNHTLSGSAISTGSFGAVHAADKVRIGLTNDGSPHLLEMKAKATGGDFILIRS